MPDREDQHPKHLAFDLVDDPVGPSPHAPLTSAAHEFRCAGWARINGEELNNGLDATLR